MYTAENLSTYLAKHSVSWAKVLPDGTPPEDVVVAYDREPLFRLIKEKDVMTEYDLKNILELNPNIKLPQDKLWQASGLSSNCTLDDARSMAKLPSLKRLQGIARITMMPEYGVMQNTPSSNCANHYTWWHTTSFCIETAEISYEKKN